jgi:hypothetical protein
MIKKFRLPISILLSLVIFQIIALIMSSIPLSRHPVDELVYRLNYSSDFSENIILGDSVTRDSIGRFRPNNKKIINLTVDEPTGIVGSYFLLNRYILKNNNKKIKNVFIIATPEFFSNINYGRHIKNRVYLNSIFKRKNEKQILKILNILPEKKKRIELAKELISIEKNLIRPLTGLIKNKKKTILIDSEFFNLEKIKEFPKKNSVSIEIFEERYEKNLEFNKESLLIYEKICNLSEKYDFKVHIVFAPTPLTLYKKWDNDGQLLNIINSFKHKKTKDCKIEFFDLNKVKTFPDYAFRDNFHLKISGWAPLYSSIIYDYIDKY